MEIVKIGNSEEGSGITTCNVGKVIKPTSCYTSRREKGEFQNCSYFLPPVPRSLFPFLLKAVTILLLVVENHQAVLEGWNA